MYRNSLKDSSRHFAMRRFPQCVSYL